MELSLSGLGIIALIALLLLDALFSASQAALSNAHRHLLREQADQGNSRAKLAYAVAEDSSRVLATFQLASLLVHFLTAAVVAGLLLDPLSRSLQLVAPLTRLASVAISYLVGFPIIGFLIYLFAELLPTTLAQRNAEAWAMALAWPARVTIVLFSPLASIVGKLRRALARPSDGDMDAGMVTEAEIMTLVDAGEEEGAIEMEEKEMIYSVFQLDQTLAREIMLPRIDMVALDIETPLPEAIDLILKSGHSRIPLYEESLDNIVGLLYAKDLLSVWSEDRQSVNLRAIMRKTHFVPETKRVLDLLRELQHEKVHMAVVIDEYGGTAGLVTIEDVVEEIVGEIRDEYDAAEEPPIERISADEFIVDARINIDELNHELDMSLPSDEADTLGGFIYEQLGKVPDIGDTHESNQIKIEVLTVVGKRIGKVRVRRLSPANPPTKDGAPPHVTETSVN